MNSQYDVVVRKAELEDAPRLYRIGLSTPELKVSSQVDFMTPKELESSITTPDGIFLLAKCDYLTVGFIFALINDLDKLPNDSQACIIYLVVVPKFRRQGVAQKLYDQLQKELTARGIVYTYVWACPTSGVVNFMERQGYKSGRTCVWMDKVK